MDRPTDDEYEAACERGRVEFETQPHAMRARYDPEMRMVVVHLYNGCVFSFPPRELEGLETATDAELDEIEVIGMGYGLHWESRDVDFTVPGLLAGRFGGAAHMAPRRARLRAMLADSTDGHRDAA